MLTQLTALVDVSSDKFNGFVDSGCIAGLQHASTLLVNTSMSFRILSICCFKSLTAVIVIFFVFSLPSSNNIVNHFAATISPLHQFRLTL